MGAHAHADLDARIAPSAGAVRNSDRGSRFGVRRNEVARPLRQSTTAIGTRTSFRWSTSVQRDLTHRERPNSHFGRCRLRATRHRRAARDTARRRLCRQGPVRRHSRHSRDRYRVEDADGGIMSAAQKSNSSAFTPATNAFHSLRVNQDRRELTPTVPDQILTTEHFGHGDTIAAARERTREKDGLVRVAIVQHTNLLRRQPLSRNATATESRVGLAKRGERTRRRSRLAPSSRACAPASVATQLARPSPRRPATELLFHRWDDPPLSSADQGPPGPDRRQRSRSAQLVQRSRSLAKTVLPVGAVATDAARRGRCVRTPIPSVTAPLSPAENSDSDGPRSVETAREILDERQPFRGRQRGLDRTVEVEQEPLHIGL